MLEKTFGRARMYFNLEQAVNSHVQQRAELKQPSA